MLKSVLDSSDCFVDPSFISSHNVPTSPLDKPVRLRLFDGSYAPSNASRFAEPPLQSTIRFLITPLESSVSAVLGYNWLGQYNPLVDWTTRRIRFRTPTTPASSSNVAQPPALPDDTFGTPPPPSKPQGLTSATLRATVAAVDIRFVNAAAFTAASRRNRLHTSVIQLTDNSKPNATLQAAFTNSNSDSEELLELRKTVSAEYHDLLDVFSKQKANTFLEHRSYDHKVNVIDELTPLGSIYSLSEAEQIALREYLAENLLNSFIKQSTSSCGVLILFVNKKDGTLRLCRLSWPQSYHPKGALPTPTRPRPPRLTSYRQTLHQTRSLW